MMPIWKLNDHYCRVEWKLLMGKGLGNFRIQCRIILGTKQERTACNTLELSRIPHRCDHHVSLTEETTKIGFEAGHVSDASITEEGK